MLLDSYFPGMALDTNFLSDLVSLWQCGLLDGVTFLILKAEGPFPPQASTAMHRALIKKLLA